MFVFETQSSIGIFWALQILPLVRYGCPFFLLLFFSFQRERQIRLTGTLAPRPLHIFVVVVFFGLFVAPLPFCFFLDVCPISFCCSSFSFLGFLQGIVLALRLSLSWDCFEVFCGRPSAETFGVLIFVSFCFSPVSCVCRSKNQPFPSCIVFCPLKSVSTAQQKHMRASGTFNQQGRAHRTSENSRATRVSEGKNGTALLERNQKIKNWHCPPGQSLQDAKQTDSGFLEENLE